MGMPKNVCILDKQLGVSVNNYVCVLYVTNVTHIMKVIVYNTLIQLKQHGKVGLSIGYIITLTFKGGSAKIEEGKGEDGGGGAGVNISLVRSKRLLKYALC